MFIDSLLSKLIIVYDRKVHQGTVILRHLTRLRINLLLVYHL